MCAVALISRCAEDGSDRPRLPTAILVPASCRFRVRIPLLVVLVASFGDGHDTFFDSERSQGDRHIIRVEKALDNPHDELCPGQ